MPLKRIYHPSAADPTIKAQSWWEASADPMCHTPAPLAGSRDCEVAIIGGGYTGLNAALFLAKAGVDVVVAEAGHIGWGASGRNGGFCANTSTKKSLGEIAAKYGLEQTRAVVRVQEEAIEQVRDFITKTGQPSHTPEKNAELAVAHSPRHLRDLQDERDELRDVLGLELKVMDKAELDGIGASSPDFHGGMILPWGFGLHPLNYLHALADTAIEAGTTLCPQTEVQKVTETDGRHILTTNRGEIHAKKLIIATNGYTAETIPPWSRGRMLPAVSSILVTRPITPEEQAEQGWTTRHMIYDSRILLHYFRLLPDGRMMFGGRGANSGDPGEQAAFSLELRRQFEGMFPAWRQVDTEYNWSGFICMNRKQAQFLGPINSEETAWSSLSYHGSGVAMASWSGRMLAELILGSKSLADLPRLYTDRTPPFPLAGLRPYYLRAAYAWFRRQDARSNWP
ncbi:MAG: FAD-binding oxidoreductase [Rhodobacteraceae bacterium]|nr:FAD-binding oxidoreductase [Paracoccaceae bacterium]